MLVGGGKIAVMNNRKTLKAVSSFILTTAQEKYGKLTYEFSVLRHFVGVILVSVCLCGSLPSNAITTVISLEEGCLTLGRLRRQTMTFNVALRNKSLDLREVKFGPKLLLMCI